MPRSAPPSPLPVRDLIGRLASPDLSTEEAEPLLAAFDGREGESALALFGLLHDSREPAILRTVSRVLARWSELPVARALVPALETLLDEPAVPPLNKMTAAGLLELYGSPVDYPGLVEGLDPEAVGRVTDEALALLLSGPQRAVTLSNALERIGGLPPDLALNLVDDLGRLGDARAEPLLAALAHAADADMALAAIAALDRLARPESHDALVRVAAHHHDPTVRAQAGHSLARLGDLARRGGSAETAAPAGRSVPAVSDDRVAPDRPPPLRAFGRLPQDHAPGLLLLVLEHPHLPELCDGFVAVLDRERGLRSYATAEALGPEALISLRRRLALGEELSGEPLVALSLAEGQWALQEAAVQALRRGDSGVDVVPALWLRFLGRALQAEG